MGNPCFIEGGIRPHRGAYAEIGYRRPVGLPNFGKGGVDAEPRPYKAVGQKLIEGRGPHKPAQLPAFNHFKVNDKRPAQQPGRPLHFPLPHQRPDPSGGNRRAVLLHRRDNGSGDSPLLAQTDQQCGIAAGPFAEMVVIAAYHPLCPQRTDEHPVNKLLRG